MSSRKKILNDLWINLHLFNNMGAVSQEESIQLRETIPNGTTDLFNYIKKSGKRNCNCKAYADIVILENGSKILGCPICKKIYYKNPEFNFSLEIIGTMGWGKTTLGMTLLLNCLIYDPSSQAILYRAPFELLKRLKSTDFCLRHMTTCLKALGLEPFNPHGAPIRYFENGELKVGIPKFIINWLKKRKRNEEEDDRTNLKKRICKIRNCKSKEDCMNCMAYFPFKNRFLNIDTLEEIALADTSFVNSIVYVDEGALSINARESLRKESKQFANLIRVGRHKRMRFIVLTQNDGSVSKEIRGLVMMFVYKRTLLKTLENGIQNSFVSEYTPLINSLKITEGLLCVDSVKQFKVTNSNGKSSKVSLITNSIPQFWTDDVSQSYMNDSSFINENQKEMKMMLNAILITQKLIQESYTLGTSSDEIRSFKSHLALKYSVTKPSLQTPILNNYTRYLSNPEAYYEDIKPHLELLKEKFGRNPIDVFADPPENEKYWLLGDEDLNEYIMRSALIRGDPRVSGELSIIELLKVYELWVKSTADSIKRLNEFAQWKTIITNIGKRLLNYAQRTLETYFDDQGSLENLAYFLKVDFEHVDLFKMYINKESLKGNISYERKYTKGEFIYICREIGGKILNFIRSNLNNPPPTINIEEDIADSEIDEESRIPDAFAKFRDWNLEPIDELDDYEDNEEIEVYDVEIDEEITSLSLEDIRNLTELNALWETQDREDDV